MSDLSDALHEAVVTAAQPFVGSMGSEIVGHVLELAGAVFSGNWDDDGA